MVAIIVICFLALAVAGFTIYLAQRAPSNANTERDLPRPRFGGLFDEDGSGVSALALAEGEEKASRLRAGVLDRARSGDLETLSEARSTGDLALYNDVLEVMVDWAVERQENLTALVSRISNSDHLRGNRRLAEHVIEAWKSSPDRRSTAEMIHVAALSDDAATYQHAVEQALDFWRLGRLPEFSADQLSELFVSQYWVIASEARRGGVGFALKRKLSGVRRELAAATPAH